MKMFLLNFFALILLIAGIIGIFIPILPTTPFLLAAALITVKSSSFLYNKITKNKYLSHFIRNYYEHCGVPRETVIKAFIFLWVSLGFSIVFTELLWVKILLAVIGIGVSCHLLMLKKNDKRELKFTLLELLVSLGIVAVLASLLLPTLNRARNSAMKSLCMDNLHQIGIAIQLYSIDNSDFIPTLLNGLSGSSMVVKMGGEAIGLGRVIGKYGTVAENYGCYLNNRNTPSKVKQNWNNNSMCQIGYFYRYNDIDFNEKLSLNSSNKAMVMDFCCVSNSSIIAHNFEDVNILYTDTSVFNRENSPIPNELYTVSTFFTNGEMRTDCRNAWENADK